MIEYMSFHTFYTNLHNPSSTTGVNHEYTKTESIKLSKYITN